MGVCKACGRRCGILEKYCVCVRAVDYRGDSLDYVQSRLDVDYPGPNRPVRPIVKSPTVGPNVLSWGGPPRGGGVA